MKFRTFLILLFCGHLLLAQNIVAPELIQNNTTWFADTVFLNADLSIEGGKLLEVEAGTVVMMNGHYAINVQGSIQAIGTAEDSIYFTVADTSGFADSALVIGGWNGLNFINTPEDNDSSLFEFCVFEFGKANGETEQAIQGGAVHVSHFDKIRITNSHFRNNMARWKGGAVFMEYCSAKINLNRFTQNMTYEWGGAIYMAKQSSGIIDRNVFKKNVAYRRFYSGGLWFTGGAGGAVCIGNEGLEDVAPTVSNNAFFNNIGVSGILYDSTVRGKLYNNTLCNNWGCPIYIGHSLCKSQVVNNTISNNELSDFNNSVIVSSSLCRLKILNNLVWNNWSSNGASDTLSLSYNDFYADSIQNNLLVDNYMEGTSNITGQDPLFVNPSPGVGLDYDGELYDWSLQDHSPAVNTGKLMSEDIYNLPEYDINFEERVYGGRIDIGAYENQNVVWNSVEAITTNSEFKVYPNPSGNFNLYIDESLLFSEIQIYNMMGQLLYSGTVDVLSYQINASNWEKGTYLYKLISEDEIAKTGKWIKI